MVFDDDARVEEGYEHPKFKTPKEIAGYLALKHANGASFVQILEWHTEILLRIGRDHVLTWTKPEELPDTSSGREVQHWLIQGGFFALNHIEWDEEWYADE